MLTKECTLQQIVEREKGHKRFASSLLSDYKKGKQKGKVVRRESLILRALELCEAGISEGFPIYILEFYGATGVGKTWLLGQIKDEIDTREEFRGKLDTLYIDLEEILSPQKDSDYQACTEEDVKRCIDSFLNAVSSTKGERKRPVVIFLDNTEWLALFPKFQDWLENWILPLARSRKVLFVLAGRYMLRWSDFTLRYKLEQVEVPGFTPEELGRLVEKYRGYKDEKLTKDLYYNWTWGYTLAAAKILESGSTKEVDIVDAIEKVLPTLFRHLRRLIFDYPSTEKELIYRLVVEGSVLRVFSSVAFKVFHQKIFGEERSSGKFQEAMRTLQKATLVTWSNEWGGYVIDQPVRYVILSWFRLKSKLNSNRYHSTPRDKSNYTFLQLQTVAKEMYKDLVMDHPMTFPSKVAGYLYHRGWELKANSNDITSELDVESKKKIIQEFEDMINIALLDAGVQWNAVDLLNELEFRIRRDEEMKVLLSKDLINLLLERVEKFRKRFY